MPFEALKQYEVLPQILGKSPTRAHLFSVRRSSLLPHSVHSLEQPFCWRVSDQNAASRA